MLPSDLNGNITTRLKTIKGQVEGIIHMLEGGSTIPNKLYYLIIPSFPYFFYK